jgi:hypothetical protein
VQKRSISQASGGRTSTLVYLVIFTFAIIVICGRLLYSGEKYGLDYEVFQPDGICYTKLALDFADADIKKFELQLSKAYPNISVVEMIELNCESVKARVLYPLLSVPFVALFGIQGMLFIPIISYLLMLLLLIRGLSKLNVSRVSMMVTISFVLMSSTVSRWYITNLVDPLLITLNCLLVYLLLTPRIFEDSKKIFLVCFIIAAMALTKRSLHLVLICGLIFAIFMYKESREGKAANGKRHVLTLLFLLPIVLDSLVQQLLGRQNGLKSIIDTQKCLKGQTSVLCENSFKPILSPETSMVVPSKLDLFQESSLNALEISIRYIYVSVAQIFVVDLPLAVVLLFWLFCFLRVPHDLNLLNLFALLSPILITFVASLNGSLGLNFRFELAFFFPVFLALAKQFDMIKRRAEL